MITMEFEEMKKVWDAQNNEPLYGINEKALHSRILSKKKQANHITNFTEFLGIIGNIGAGCFIFSMSFFRHSGNVFMYLLSAWMVIAALYLLTNRIRRRKTANRFDKSMRGDLSQAIAVATYQVHLSQLMRWNAIPVGMLILLGLWESGKSIWIAVGILIFFVLVNYAAGWELNMYKNRKRELGILQSKLENE